MDQYHIMDIEKILVSGLVISHRKLIIKQKKKKEEEASCILMGEGEGGTIWGNGTETCIISYKK